MSVSVFSALTRLGVDPWGEAKRLSELPGAQAARALEELVARLIDGLSETSDSKQIAARLIRLLPNQVGTRKSVAEAPRRSAAPIDGLNVWIAKILALPVAFWLAAFILAMSTIYILSSNTDVSWSESNRSMPTHLSAPQN